MSDIGPNVSVFLRADDPFDELIIPIVETNRRKRADYTHGGDIYSNFREVATATGLTPVQVADVMVAVKSARIKALEVNQKEPDNEAVVDSYLDRAVYSILAYGLKKGEAATDFVADRLPEGKLRAIPFEVTLTDTIHDAAKALHAQSDHGKDGEPLDYTPRAVDGGRSICNCVWKADTAIRAILLEQE